MHSNILKKLQNLKKSDLEIYDLIKKELNRQEFGLEMIASENYVSLPVLEAQGSILTNKYAEGYPGKRYYGGCEYIDQIESLAIERAKKLFNAESVNVQAHSGSQANMVVYFALLKPGDTFMGMDLSHGGHLTHGSKVNFSGALYQTISYGVNSNSELLDYTEILDLAKKTKPKLIIAGYSAYPRVLDFPKFQEIAKSVQAKLLVDMAHFAGLVAGNVHPSPVPYADFITSTTHKTLRGPRGGLILTKKENEKKINSKLFPGLQGGPLEHVIAGKAICFQEALTPEFKTYAHQIILNAKTLASELLAEGLSLVTGGTDNHLILINLSKSKPLFDLTGAEAEKILEKAGITVNKNTVPNEKRSPFITSGIRIGTPALTSRGFKETEMKRVGKWISKALKNFKNEDQLKKIKNEVSNLCKEFPIYDKKTNLP